MGEGVVRSGMANTEVEDSWTAGRAEESSLRGKRRVGVENSKYSTANGRYSPIVTCSPKLAQPPTLCGLLAVFDRPFRVA